MKKFLIIALAMTTLISCNSNTGNMIQNRAYHSFEFNDAGQIHELRDYFDASGAMNAAFASEE